MQFTIHEDTNEELIWSLILNNLSSILSTEAFTGNKKSMVRDAINTSFIFHPKM